MTGAELAARFPGSKRSGTGWRAPCLAHGSKGGTLSIGEGRDGRLLLKCFAGCEAAEIAAAVGLELRDLMGQAANDQWSAVRPHRQPTRGEIREALRAAATGYRADHRLDAADRLVAADVNAIRHAVAARLGASGRATMRGLGSRRPRARSALATVARASLARAMDRAGLKRAMLLDRVVRYARRSGLSPPRGSGDARSGRDRVDRCERRTRV